MRICDEQLPKILRYVEKLQFSYEHVLAARCALLPWRPTTIVRSVPVLSILLYSLTIFEMRNAHIITDRVYR